MDFEIQLIATVLDYPDEFVDVLPLVTNSHLSRMETRWMWSTIKAYHRVDGKIPTREILAHKLDGEQSVDLRGLVTKALGAMQDRGSANKEYFRKEVLDYCHRESIERCMLEARDQLALGNTHKAVSILRGIQDKREVNSAPCSFVDFELKPDRAEDEIIVNRFFCKGHGMLLYAPSGIGKSTFTIQLGANLCLGKETLGFTATRPHRVLVIQAEDDDGDVARMTQSVLRKQSIERESQGWNQLRDNMHIIRLMGFTGDEFFSRAVTLLNQYKPDVLIINPMLRYLGADISSQKDVGAFLCNCDKIIERFNIGLILVHHTGKQRREKVGNGYDFLGSSWLAGWARSQIAIREVTRHSLYELSVEKRTLETVPKYIKHSSEPNTLYWEKTDIKDVLVSAKRQAEQLREQMLTLIPQEPSSISKNELAKQCSKSEATIRAQMQPLLLSLAVKEVRIPTGRGGSDLTAYSRPADNHFEIAA